MRERNLPRNIQPETHPDDERGAVLKDRTSIGWIDFQMPPKTHKESCREAASLLFDMARLRSNSTGGR